MVEVNASTFFLFVSEKRDYISCGYEKNTRYISVHRIHIVGECA